ncbi:MAG: hypothetical protein JW801_06235 [Bacteroidales bacterium]|nr:hypothetical protein [Bacteroidales bacterium]
MRIIFSLATLILFFVNSYSQILSTEEETRAITDIRAKYKLINEQQDTYVKKTGPLEDYSTEGGEYVVYYAPENDPRKIIASYYGEMGRLVNEYYLWDGEVFFVFRQRYTYNSHIYMTEDIPEEGIEAFDDSKTLITTNRYYFLDGQMIRWLDDEKNKIDPASEEFKEEAVSCLEDNKFILNIIETEE